MNNPAMETVNTGDNAAQLSYQTRFGEVKLREDRLIAFPKGMPGFPHCTVFGLAQMPNMDESPMLLLQCVNDPNLTFMVADPQVMGLDIANDDRLEATAEAGVNPADAQFLVMLSLHGTGDPYYLTANLRAPLVIDSARRVGMQHIFLNKDYTTQHKI